MRILTGTYVLQIRTKKFRMDDVVEVICPLCCLEAEDIVQSKKISNDQELIQSDPTSCPQNQKGNNKIHKLTAVYERHSR